MQASIDGNLITFANQLADAAGAVIRRHWQTALSVEHKADLSPVTQADREAEAAMRQMIESHYPEHGILGEEHGVLNPQSAFQWVLDPIDGTKAFIAGQPTFTTLIALCRDGIPIIGVIDQPVTHERWLGAPGRATNKNGKITAVRGDKELSDAVLSTTSTEYFLPGQAQAFSQLQKQCGKFLLGGDGYAYAMLASGKLDMVADAQMKPYDFCALAPVVSGAGGTITDWKGEALTISSKGTVLAAGDDNLHRQALKSLLPAA